MHITEHLNRMMGHTGNRGDFSLELEMGPDDDRGTARFTWLDEKGETHRLYTDLKGAIAFLTDYSTL